MTTKTTAPYFPTLNKLQSYQSTEDSCNCPSHTKGHRTCKHMLAVKMYRKEAAHPANLTVLNCFGRPDCDCYNFRHLGECVHVYALQQYQAEAERLDALRSELIAEFG